MEQEIRKVYLDEDVCEAIEDMDGEFSDNANRLLRMALLSPVICKQRIKELEEKLKREKELLVGLKKTEQQEKGENR